MTTSVHDWPPSLLTPATSPRAPPSDQRSCCQLATMLLASVGFTSTQGSTSVLAKFVPVCPESAVHAANGLAPETCIGVEAVKRPAHAAAAASAPTTTTMVTRRRRLSAGIARTSPLDCSRLEATPRPRGLQQHRLRSPVECQNPVRLRNTRALSDRGSSLHGSSLYVRRLQARSGVSP